MKKLFQNATLVLSGLLLSFVLAEVVLRIHNPLRKDTVERYGNVWLPTNDKVWTYRVYSPDLPEQVVLKRNELGFRGDEPPRDFDDHLTIVSVGGSTTASAFFSDGLTWTDRLGRKLQACFDSLWINNAGLDGHTTFGNLELMRNYIVDIRPDVVLMLVGGNDAIWTKPNQHDRNLGTLGDPPISLRSHPSQPTAEVGGVFVSSRFSQVKDLTKALAARSEALSTTIQIFRILRLRYVHKNRLYPYRDWPNLEEGDPYPEGGKADLAQRRRSAVPMYKQRVQELVDVAREAGIVPVLMTQPIPFGPVIDPATGKDLSRILHGAYRWDLFELYNNATREVARNNDVLLVDLSWKMPKTTSLYFDVMHYNLEGEELVARLVYNEMREALSSGFGRYNSRSCRVESTDLADFPVVVANR